MILIDSSAWIDYLRGEDTAACVEVRRLLRDETALVATCEPVAMELLAGAGAQLDTIQRLVDGLPALAVDPRLDFRTAAALYRAARLAGRTVRSLNDCLIAAVALQHGAAIVHKDVDFEVLSSITALEARSFR